MRRNLILTASAVAFVFLAGSAGLHAVRAEAPIRPAALDRARVPTDVLPPKVSAILAQGGFAVDTSRRADEGLYLVERQRKELCYVALFSERHSGGCNPKANFFGDRALIAGLGQDTNGSEISLLLAGVARPDIQSVRVGIGNETSVVDVNRDGGFWFSKAIEASALPAAVNVDAVGRSGRTIGSYAIPTD